jgi:hypothetical protein
MRLIRFVGDFWYFRKRGYTVRAAWQLARATL